MKPYSIIDNVFDEVTVSCIFEECEKHLKDNLLANDELKITKSILDCHGLALSTDKYFPYSIPCWNKFCLIIKKHVVDYCKEDPIAITPFSCWAEKSGKISGNAFRDSPVKVMDTDGQVKNKFIRTVYNLKTPNKAYGTKLIYKNDTKFVSSENNRLLIYDDTCISTHYYPSYSPRYNVIFDWYINIPFKIPDWILP
jgi:hypothetical protein